MKSLDSPMRVYAELTCARARLDDPATVPQAIARVLGNCRERCDAPPRAATASISSSRRPYASGWR
jgi:hypothetical protein